MYNTTAEDFSSEDTGYTPQQELFLEYLFNDPECDHSVKLAALKAGYSEKYVYPLSRTMSDEILKRSNQKLSLEAPRAVSKLIGAMDEDGSTPKADIRLKAVESVLDRIGLAKKQEMSVSIDSESPLFFIPSKSFTDSSKTENN